jgi:hypothetical protein
MKMPRKSGSADNSGRHSSMRNGFADQVEHSEQLEGHPEATVRRQSTAVHGELQSVSSAPTHVSSKVCPGYETGSQGRRSISSKDSVFDVV